MDFDTTIDGRTCLCCFCSGKNGQFELPPLIFAEICSRTYSTIQEAHFTVQSEARPGGAFAKSCGITFEFYNLKHGKVSSCQSTSWRFKCKGKDSYGNGCSFVVTFHENQKTRYCHLADHRKLTASRHTCCK